MTEKCAECGGTTIWDSDAGSAICTLCGTLTDPSQSVLASHIDHSETSNQFSGLWDPAAPTTLKRSRPGANWDLAGQGKEARDRKNAYAMAEFIKSLALSMNAAGLSPRATALFKQAMDVQPFRWGRKAKIVGGVCLAIALRESHRPISLDDIAFLLDEPTPQLKRTFLSLISLLKLNVSTLDPSVHISTLHSFLTSELQGQQDTILPSSLVQLLKPLSLRVAAATANSLCTLLARLSSNALHLPTPPTACAIFMLALEAESRATFNKLSELGQILGSRVHAGKGVVMSRYKTIQDEVHNWIEAVAWLEKFSASGGRAKVSKRLVVARGLKDVLQFQEEIWQVIRKPKLTFDLSDDEESQLSASRSASPALTSIGTQGGHSRIRTRKRQKTRHFLQGASQFLLDPLSGPIPSSNTSAYLRDMAGPNDGSLATSNDDLPLTSFLLMAPSSSLTEKKPPTRLQKLAILRGSADEISDDELFDEGELEGMLRSEDQIDGLRQVLGWDVNGSGSDSEGEQDAGKTVKSRKKGNERKSTSKETGESRKSRVDLEALAQFLQEDGDDDNDNDAMLGLEFECFSDKSDSCDDTTHGMDFDHHTPKDQRENESHSDNEGGYPEALPQPLQDPGEEVLIDNWRPVSPEGGAYLDYYDEEYD